MSEREKLIDILVMSPMSDSVGPLMSPVERTATQILDSEWLASVKSEAWQEGAYAALEEEGYECIKFDFVSETNPY
jgi:hypothetical protein